MNYFVLVMVELTWELLEIDIDKIEEAITPKTKGVMIVHLYGRIAYNDKLGEICKKQSTTEREVHAGSGWCRRCELFNGMIERKLMSCKDYDPRRK